jgi:hypothetical protein
MVFNGWWRINHDNVISSQINDREHFVQVIEATLEVIELNHVLVLTELAPLR